MTSYKQYDIPVTKQLHHIPYGHELTSQEKELLQRVKEKKAKRQQLLQEVRRNRARTR